MLLNIPSGLTFTGTVTGPNILDLSKGDPLLHRSVLGWGVWSVLIGWGGTLYKHGVRRRHYDWSHGSQHTLRLSVCSVQGRPPVNFLVR